MSDEGDLSRVYFLSRKCVESWLTNELPSLNNNIRPSHFGHGGRCSRRQTNEIADRERFQHFREQHRENLSLYGDSFTFDLEFCERVPSSITLWMPASDSRFASDVPLLFKTFSRCAATWGFAAEWEEYAARNQYKKTYVEGGGGTGFIGKDFRRYVPGLYWFNYFSSDYIVQMEIRVEELAAQLGGMISELPEGKTLQLYTNPRDWRSRRDEVESRIQKTKDFFSMRNVHIPPNLSRRNPKDFMWSPGEEWP